MCVYLCVSRDLIRKGYLIIYSCERMGWHKLICLSFMLSCLVQQEKKKVLKVNDQSSMCRWFHNADVIMGHVAFYRRMSYIFTNTRMNAIYFLSLHVK